MDLYLFTRQLTKSDDGGRSGLAEGDPAYEPRAPFDLESAILNAHRRPSQPRPLLRTTHWYLAELARQNCVSFAWSGRYEEMTG
jgi:hypothetical protein